MKTVKLFTTRVGARGEPHIVKEEVELPANLFDLRIELDGREMQIDPAGALDPVGAGEGWLRLRVSEGSVGVRLAGAHNALYVRQEYWGAP